jgi:endonuclease V-like protein UPF0215 family
MVCGMTRYAKRTDGNHADIRDALKAIPGVNVLDTAAMSGLGCDLLVFYQERPAFLEIKNGAKNPLTDSERRLKKYAGANWHRVETFDDALRALGISTEPAPKEW